MKTEKKKLFKSYQNNTAMGVDYLTDKKIYIYAVFQIKTSCFFLKKKGFLGARRQIPLPP